jgi:hypothetical protein
MSQQWKEEQLRAARQPFVWDCARSNFTESEAAYLDRWGSWLKALWDFTIPAKTDAQAKFVRLTRGNICGETQAEVLWIKYIRRSGYVPDHEPSRDDLELEALDSNDLQRTTPSSSHFDEDDHAYAMDETAKRDENFEDVEEFNHLLENGVYPDPSESESGNQE